MFAVTVFVFSLSSMSFPADAKAGFAENQHHEKKQHRQFKRMAKHLELNDQQKAQIKSLKGQAKANRTAMKEKMKSYKVQVKALVQAEYFDENAFVTLQQSYQDVFAQAALSRAKHQHEMMKILTPEQQKKAEKMKKRMKGKR